MGNGERETGNGERGSGNGEQRTGNGELRTGNKEWGMENGIWKTRNGEWKIVNSKLTFSTSLFWCDSCWIEMHSHCTQICGQSTDAALFEICLKLGNPL